MFVFMPKSSFNWTSHCDHEVKTTCTIQLIHAPRKPSINFWYWPTGGLPPKTGHMRGYVLICIKLSTYPSALFGDPLSYPLWDDEFDNPADNVREEAIDSTTQVSDCKSIAEAQQSDDATPVNASFTK